MCPKKFLATLGSATLFVAFSVAQAHEFDSYADGYVVTPEKPVDHVFAIGGDLPIQLLLTGLGPTLEAFGRSDTLENPTIQLLKINDDGTETLIDSNDDWEQHPTADAVERAIEEFNGQSLDSQEAAMIKSLVPGTYRLRLIGATADSEGFASAGAVRWNGDLGDVEDPSQPDSIRSGVWENITTNYEVCFFVGGGGTVLTARGSQCPDRDAFDIEFERGMTGACDDGNFNWDEGDIPIRNNTFTKTFTVPNFYGPRIVLKVVGTFSDGVLSGTFTKTINGQPCTGEFTATPRS